MNSNESTTALIQLSPFCLTRQDAIAFLNVKASFFDEHIRPRLRSVRAGTSLLFLREEAEALARDMFNGAEVLGQERAEDTKAAHPRQGLNRWERKQAGSTKGSTGAGPSTSTSTAYGFTKALTRLKTQKPG